MAKIIRRIWTTQGATGKRVRHVAYGYTLMVHGKRERRISSEWLTEADAMAELAERTKAVEAGDLSRPVDRTLGELAEEYLRYKMDHGKRTLKDDERIIRRRLLPAFGPAAPARRVTAAAIAQYEKQRAGQVSAYTVANELSVLRHMLRLAKRWGYLTATPDIEMPKKPDERRRYLDEDEIRRLLDASAQSRNRYLHAVVVIALNGLNGSGSICRAPGSRSTGRRTGSPGACRSTGRSTRRSSPSSRRPGVARVASSPTGTTAAAHRSARHSRLR